MNIARIVDEVRAGNLVITPTDTVYGILADAMNPVAVENVFRAKRRSGEKPLILLVSDQRMLRKYVKNLNGLEEKIIDNYMPGKLTLLLKRNEKISDRIVNGGELVGIRIPDNTELREIITKVGNPLVSTSANLSGKAVVASPEMLEAEVLAWIAYIEDAGAIKSEPSALIKVADGKIEVLRDGEVTRKILDSIPKD